MSCAASIGSLAPQKYVWKIVAALQCGPRLLLVGLNTAQLGRLARPGHPTVSLALALSLAEVAALMVISIVPSIEDVALHSVATGFFLVCSPAYMLISYYLLRSLHSGDYIRSHGFHIFSCSFTGGPLRSLHYKRVLMTVHLCSILASLYCYWRHNTYCEPGMYSTFSLFEYTVVLTNMAFHATSYYDFYNVNLSLNSF